MRRLIPSVVVMALWCAVMGTLAADCARRAAEFAEVVQRAT